MEMKNVYTVEQLEKALEHYRVYTGTLQKYLRGEYECDEGDSEIELFGKVLAAVIIDESIGKRGGKHGNS